MTDRDALQIEVDGLRFDAKVAGEPGAPLVLLLHGFPQTHHTWRAQLPALAAAGFRAVAPNQRGYSPGARPEGVDAYATDLLVADALAIAERSGSKRFHVVGHDWGGQLAWLLAARQPECIRTLTVLSRPHPAAFARALREDEAQAGRSGHHRAFQSPDVTDRLLADGARALRDTLRAQGVPERDVASYIDPLASRAALDAALHWYRAAARAGPGLAAADVPRVAVPTLYLWGDADATVGRRAAELTREYATGPYRFVELPGVGHFVTDQAAERVTDELLAHLARDS